MRVVHRSFSCGCARPVTRLPRAKRRPRTAAAAGACREVGLAGHSLLSVHVVGKRIGRAFALAFVSFGARLRFTPRSLAARFVPSSKAAAAGAWTRTRTGCCRRRLSRELHEPRHAQARPTKVPEPAGATRALPNPSLERTLGGMPPRPPSAVYHVAPGGRGAMPPRSAQLKR